MLRASFLAPLWESDVLEVSSDDSGDDTLVMAPLYKTLVLSKTLVTLANSQ